MNKNLLLGSGGTAGIAERVNAWKSSVKQHIGQLTKVMFIPYALADHDAYLDKMNSYHDDLDVKMQSVHQFDSAHQALEDADVIYIGGGNTFRLLYRLQQYSLYDIIREKVRAGTPYIGISAGTNVACPTICNTNDMPIMHPPQGFDALNLIPFQINAHYTDGTLYYGPDKDHLKPYGGESRDDRLREYHEENQTPVLALSEGSILHVDNDQYRLGGVGYAKLLKPNHDPQRFEVGSHIVVD